MLTSCIIALSQKGQYDGGLNLGDMNLQGLQNGIQVCYQVVTLH